MYNNTMSVRSLCMAPYHGSFMEYSLEYSGRVLHHFFR